MPFGFPSELLFGFAGILIRRHEDLPVRLGGRKQAWMGNCYLPPTTPIQAREHAGRNVFSLIVQMSSSRLFLDRVARQQSPSPLHRLIAIVLEKGLEVITIPANGNCVFYAVSHWRGSPGRSVCIRVHHRPFPKTPAAPSFTPPPTKSLPSQPQQNKSIS